MTMITIDPNELTAVSTLLRHAGSELADVGSQLAPCIGCPLPPAIAGDVAQMMAGVDLLLDQIGGALHTEASGLERRGGLATTESLVTASMSPLAGMGFDGVVGGDPLYSDSGGSGSNPGFDGVVRGPWDSDSPPTYIVDGREMSGSELRNLTGIGGSAMVGGPISNPLMSLAEAGGRKNADIRAGINQAIANPGSSAAGDQVGQKLFDKLVQRPYWDGLRQDIDYNKYATWEFQMGREPKPQHAWHGRPGPL